MTFIFDENFSKNLANGLNLLERSNPRNNIPVTVVSAEELMGKRGATDQEIIKAAGPNSVVFTKDKDFRQIKLYGKIIEQTGVKVLFFKSSSKFIFFWDILIAIVTNWETIKENLTKDVPPFVYEFDIKKGIKECHL
jgi:hypothetical protein